MYGETGNGLEQMKALNSLKTISRELELVVARVSDAVDIFADILWDLSPKLCHVTGRLLLLYRII